MNDPLINKITFGYAARVDEEMQREMAKRAPFASIADYAKQRKEVEAAMTKIVARRTSLVGGLVVLALYTVGLFFQG